MSSKTFELAENQKGIYFDCQVDNPLDYNISATIRLQNVDEKHLENALKLVVWEQEALRTKIDIQHDFPVFSTLDEIDFMWVKQDLSQALNQHEELSAIIREEIGTAFDLSSAPLFRARLIKLNEAEHLFVVCIHHIISDGMSLEIFRHSLLDYYDRLIHKKKIVLKQNTGFSDFIKQENSKLTEGKFDKQKEYWSTKLQGAEPVSIQHDYSIKQFENGVGREKRFEVPQALVDRASQLAREHEVTDFMFYLAIFGVFLNRYTQREDISFATSLSYRPDMDFEETIGYFVSMLPMRFDVQSDQFFPSVLKQVSQELIQAYKNIGYPNNLILRDQQLATTPGTPSIFDLSFIYDAYEEVGADVLQSEIVEQDHVTFPGNLMVIWNKTEQRSQLKIQYKPEMFSDQSIELLGCRFLKIIEALTLQVESKVGEIDLLLENEETRIFRDFNRVSPQPYKPQSIIDIFNTKVQLHPTRVALIYNGRSETYASVQAKANQLARKIIERVNGEQRAIGVQLQRSPDLVITLLAILKAGCAYVPIDPAYPRARKEYIFHDASIPLLITSQQLPHEHNWEVDLLFVDDSDTYTGPVISPLEELDPTSLAYIIYTSGSTGKPKGVMIENHSVVNTLLDLEGRFPLGKEDIFLLKTPFTFDVSATELFGWFVGEGSLLILEHGEEKNPQFILEEINTYNVTHINFVPTMFRLFLELFEVEANISKMSSLKWVFLGGEAVTPDLLQKFNALHTDIRLENVYGPTESTIWVSHSSLKNDSENQQNISIGQPLHGMRWYVIGKNKELQPIGIPGELCLSGPGLARGYLNQEELTKEKFISNPFFDKESDSEYYRLMYRTGDLARWTSNGTIEFLGRIDFQVKIRGARLEIGEIESVLAEYRGIVQAVVVVKEGQGRAKELCAYYLADEEIEIAKLKEHVSQVLPAYMIPSFFVHKEVFPLNSSDKVDRNALTADTEYLQTDSASYVAPQTELEHNIVKVWGEVLAISKIGVDDHFFEIGGNSVNLIQVHNRLRKALKQDFSITLLVQSPTVRQLAEHFFREKDNTILNRESHFERDKRIVRQDIAIVGLAINVPGAQSTNEFWNNLKLGKESIHFYSDDELAQLGVDQNLLKSPNYVKAKGKVDGIEYFDPHFFDYTPGEVHMMSPQLRLLYQGTWQALEDAGYYPNSKTKIGLFLGGSDDFEWYRKVLFSEGNFSDKYQAFTLSTNHFLATRVAHKLDIKGPVYSALTGCSTTLVTPHLATQSLILGECDLAVAGGITVELPNEGGYFYEEGMMFSPDGHCRPFDANARGTVFSNGMGLVVLKRLDEAIADGDQIYAVIKGSAINNDGKQKAGFVAPSVEGQAEAIHEAYRVAGIDPETVSYVEAHGTGTLIGDPIEVESLTKAFGSDKKQFCMLGSVKGNVGHTDTAAGVVGLAKVALSLKNKYIPGTVNYKEQNPKINFKNTPFMVQENGMEWEKEGALRAGINSFGVGGTNAHMVLEEPPMESGSSPSDKLVILPFSAKSPTALKATSVKVVNYLLKDQQTHVSDAAWTLQVGRKPFSYRRAMVIQDDFRNDPEKALELLNAATVHEMMSTNKKIYFMFPGQGSQYQGMGRELYFNAHDSAVSRLFKKYIDSVYDLLKAEERNQFLGIIYGVENPQQINQTEFSQFALFATSYALAKTMLEIGIKPAGMLGHSIGEVAAATVAGVFELKDAVEIVRLRGQVMQKQEPGVMLAVMTSAKEVEQELPSDVWLSLENTSSSCVVGGNEQAISQFEAKLQKLGWKFIRVKTSHAFHTPMMEKAAQEFKDKLRTYKMNEPQIPILSNATGKWVQEKEMTKPEYWSQHILQTVKFADNLSVILSNNQDLFIEVGAGRTLSTFARQHDAKASRHHFVHLIRHPQEVASDVEFLNEKVAELWSVGVDIAWDVLKGEKKRKRISLPTYEFDKMFFPVDVGYQNQLVAQKEVAVSSLEAIEYRAPLSIQVAGDEEGFKTKLEGAIIEAYKALFGFETVTVDQDFFALGGDSLKAVSLSSTLKNVVGTKVDITDLFKYPTPSALAAFLSESSIGNVLEAERDEEKRGSKGIKPAEEREYYPLSAAQKRMYALYLLDRNNLAYNLPSATIIHGQLDRVKIEHTFEKLIQRHEGLRTSFGIKENEPAQFIHSTTNVPIRYTENKVSHSKELNQIINDFVKPFDLEKAPLFRIEMVQLESEKKLLLLDFHHIIADGSSVEIITRDFNQLYSGDIRPLNLQYKDFAVWQNERLSSDGMSRQRDFWLQQLEGELPALELPTDYARPPVKDFKGARAYFDLDQTLTSELQHLAQASGTTLYMLLLSAWYVLLARYASQEDIVVGTPVAGRTQEEIEDTVGMFVNMLAMRNFPQPDKSFHDFLNEVKENTLRAFDHQDYQFDELVEQLDLKRELNRNALFDVCFDFQNMEFHDLELEDIRFTPYKIQTQTAAYDLILTCQENKKDQQIEGFLEYSTGLFKQETVERMVEHFRMVLWGITVDNHMLLGDLNVITPWEKDLINKELNQTSLSFNDTLLIQDLFEQNVAKHPDKTALIVASGKALTYEELNIKANEIAWELIHVGMEKEAVVGVMCRRDEYLFISLLGVLKAGLAYVPIDPTLPKERIAYMLSECNVSTLICHQEDSKNVEFSGHIINYNLLNRITGNRLTENPPNHNSTNSLACVIFTSGSTGKPKGVMIEQRSLVNFIHDIENRGIFTEDSDRVLCVTTLSFDIFAFESIVPMCTGHSVYLANEEEQLDPALVTQKITEHKLTHILSTVSRIKVFVENPEFDKALKQLKCVLSGGENYPLQLLKDIQSKSQAKVYNMYGPTETTVWSTTKDLTDSDKINIGRPIANTEAYIINTAGKLQPIGVYGELCLAGLGLARAYLNNSHETMQKFVQLSAIPDKVLYRTGDRARILDSGEIELVGRLDSQVKIRGYRIELNEIEQLALKHEHIRQAVVKTYDVPQRDKQLVLFYSLKRVGLEKDNDPWLKDWLKQTLPHYMVPSHFIQLDELPVLPNGKINKQALSLPQEMRSVDKMEIIPPSSKLEKAILAIWKEVLNTESISVRDNFFDVGGHSLGLIHVNNKVNELLGQSIPLMQFFEHPTIESLVKSLALSKTKIDEHLFRVDGPPNRLALDDIAVIGMSCHFPGANDINSFWDNILSGEESITTFSEEELLQSGIDREALDHPNYVKAKGFLEGIEYFDADFFDYPSQESNMMDPQIRIMHQCVWEVLENAGYDSSAYAGRIGLFAGSGSNIPWMTKFLGKQKDLLQAFEAMTLNEKDFLTTRISYKLNLKGPSFNVQTACSTSLVAIHQAIQSLISGEADMAIAGGVSISYPRKEGYLWHEGMIFSKDGHCKPFAEDSSGTISGNGCGLVLLKPLAAAERDGDHIYGVIKGSAINNDGIDKIGYTAPSIAGQADVIEAALNKAGLSAEDICYLEAHGTGTKLGDPIEIEALKQAWKTDKKGYCALGSVKANIGHLDAAAGVAGFIKTILALYHRTIPGQINFQKPNPRIDFDNSPFYINTRPVNLTHSSEVLRAGISSFGIGGTNVHVIVEQPPAMKAKRYREEEHIKEPQVLLFSARSESALEQTSEKLLSYLKAKPSLNLADVAWTLQMGRKSFEYRKALVVKGKLSGLSNQIVQDFIQISEKKVSDIRKRIVFMFPGEEYFSLDMGRQLYLSADRSSLAGIYRDCMNHALSFMQQNERENVMKTIRDKHSDLHSDTKTSQLTQLVTGYALAQTLIELGVHADGVMGQNIGLITALAVAGSLDMREAVALIRRSGIEDYQDHLARVQLRIPKTPLLLATAGGIGKKDQQAQRNVSERLAPNSILSLDEVLESPSFFIEVGSGGWQFSFINQHIKAELDAERHGYVHLLSDQQIEDYEIMYFLQVMGQLWSEGVSVQWDRLHQNKDRKRLPLPSYVFDKTYHEHDINLTSIIDQEYTSKTREQTLVIREDNNEVPREDITTRLSSIWEEILGHAEIAAEDDFFTLGGHSLKAVTLASELQKEFSVDMPLSEIFNHSVFNQMENWLISREVKHEFQQIQPVVKQSYYKVSSAQKRMFAVNELIEGAVPYNLASIYIVEGAFDIARFSNVIAELVHRHAAFRTRFSMVDGEVVQIIEDEVDSVVQDGRTTEARIEDEIKEFIRPFELTKAPLLRVKVLQVTEMKHLLMIDMHHIISDQSSIAILLQEIKALYAGNRLDPLKIQYTDFAAWQNELLKSKAIEKQFDYWKQELSGEFPKLNLLTDHSRPLIQSFKGDHVSFEFGQALSLQVDEISKSLKLTPYMVLLATLNVVLWKYSGQQDLIVGTGIAGRRHPDVDAVVGMFVNTLAIRTQINESASVEEFLMYLKDKLANVYENQDCQYEQLIEELGIEKELGRNPLFDIMFNYITMGTEELSLEGITFKPLEFTELETKFDITLTIQQKGNGYFADIEYSTALFKRETIQAFGEKLLWVASQITDNYKQTLSEISIVTAEERNWLSKLNQTTTDYPRDKTIVQLFEEKVESHGEYTAIIWGQDHISYAELNSRANRVADLLNRKFVNPKDRIALMFDRGPLQVISILGILKAGCVYVPIDPDYPEQRIQFILENSSATLLLTDSGYEAKLEQGTPYLLLDSELEQGEEAKISFGETQAESSADDLAYIIYTSGSTGEPKGTLISNRNVTRVVKNTNYIDITPKDRLLQFSNYAFDGSVFDIFGALLNGAALVMISKEELLEISELTNIIKKQEITVFFITTAMFNMVVDWDVSCLQHTRKILFGGEAASIPHVKKAFAYLGPDRLINVYGPTETTVFATYYPINEAPEDASYLPIGFPIANTTAYILDGHGHPVPPNVPGELYIGGDGVSEGYVNKAELTKQKFIQNPFDPSERVYCTGDIVWRLPTGEIGFIGRRDFQVKIRGFRVELGEIEKQFKSIEGVKDVIVVPQKDKQGNMYLAAYYSTTMQSNGLVNQMKPEQIGEALSDKLPNYMIPAKMMRMDNLPLNSNGKIDRKHLPDLNDNAEAVAPTLSHNEAEQVVLQKMREVLDNESFGMADHFFRYGGHSIRAIALVQSLSKLGVNLKVNEIFQYPTAEEIAKLPKVREFFNKSEKNGWSMADSEPININSIHLNEQQMNSLAEHVYHGNSFISKTMIYADKVGVFPFSPVQKAHTLQGSHISGFTTELEGPLNEQMIKRILMNIVQKNQLLHCVAQMEGEPVWQECDVSGVSALIEKNIPYIDLREYTEQTQLGLLDKLFMSILATPYEFGGLPWRITCLRMNQELHLLIWGFDHMAFDGMSGEVLRHQIEKEAQLFLMPDSALKSAPAKVVEESPQNYQDYVTLLTQGPSNMTEEEIIEQFTLIKWSESNSIFMDRLRRLSDGGQKVIDIRLPLHDSEKVDPWMKAFEFTIELFHQYTKLNDIPIAIVDYGRSYNNTDFYNSVGEFLDIIPFVAEVTDSKSHIVESLKECRQQSINFLSLLYEPSLSKKYANVVDLLAPAYKNKEKDLILFNFQGYVEQSDKMAFRLPAEQSLENSLAQVLVTVDVDVEYINIKVESLMGFDQTSIRTIIPAQEKVEKVGTHE
ncbi:non-ribosomal peptide synthetase/type I polyketide synthase [Bacillus horti]|uniref:Amino acid adenylation domain-containing protein n=1 Tax=Caldalkalibacillus horti TaxID=77523 RepID=A0ABT9VVT3_9BACI|nr:non-ribosomal peptide synthetase/type I polyketide synthase [Bacillus horti]MDQ0164745.1 amino acid adenylation domain-containing protein [Bacillus horti]